MPLKPVKNGFKSRNSPRQTANHFPKDERMYLLVQGGEHILSMNENSPETDNKELIEKSEKIYR